MATVAELVSADDFAQIPDDGRRTELIRGRIVELPPTNYLHGFVCLELGSRLRNWLKERRLGRAVSNDSGIITQRNPDSLRGADLAYYSYARLAEGKIPSKYPDIAPDIVIEVRSPSDRWSDIREKVNEYLAIGVLIVCVIDPEMRTAWFYSPDQPDRLVGPEGELTFPECLPDFSVPMPGLFE